jgi:hypothetical protein
VLVSVVVARWSEYQFVIFFIFGLFIDY